MEEENKRVLFRNIYSHHCFSVSGLALQAGVSVGTVDRMREGLPVPKGGAEHVLKALSLRTGEHYTLSNVEVKLVNDDQQLAGGMVP